jgi:hypothetical protein
MTTAFVVETLAVVNARALVSASLAAAVMTACAAANPAPEGWQAVAGAPQTWSKGPGQAAEQYALEKKSFSGTLQQLASQEVIDVALRYRGAKFVGSDVFAPCPGLAAVANFTLGDRDVQQGFSVQGNQAVLVTYTREKGAVVDAAASAAMERALCVMP